MHPHNINCNNIENVSKEYKQVPKRSAQKLSKTGDKDALERRI